MRIAVIAQLYTYPAPPHFMGDRRRGAGTEEGIQYQITGTGGNLQNTLNQMFWLGRVEGNILEKYIYMTFCTIIRTNFISIP